MSHSSHPFVSVIIPVFNDAERLKLCLEALESQTYPGDRYEIIVVDNGSTEDIKCAVEPFHHAIYAHEARPGSYAARNTALTIAQGEVLAFTDADCIPAHTWLEHGVRHLQQTPNCGLVAGRIELFFHNPSCPTAVELYDNVKIGFPQQKFVEESNYGATANVFTWRSVMDVVGPFDATLKSSGDREWGQRVFAAGYQQLYAEDTCVSHPARRTWGELHKKVVRITGGHLDLEQKRGSSSVRFVASVLLASLKDFLPPFRMYFHICSYKNLHGHKQRIQFTIAMLYVRYVRGWERLRLLAGGASTRG
jgi:glycosyltransferase involved in cell wall biosynthesis